MTDENIRALVALMPPAMRDGLWVLCERHWYFEGEEWLTEEECETAAYEATVNARMEGVKRFRDILNEFPLSPIPASEEGS